MCKCCAQIEKGLAIFFTLSRIFFIILASIAIEKESKLEKIKEDDQGSLFGVILGFSIFNFFTLWSTFCCVEKEEKECCQNCDDSSCCALCWATGFICTSTNDENYNTNVGDIIALFLLGIGLFKLYIMILVKCCGKRSRYCIQIFCIFMDLEAFVLILTSYKKLTAFFIILEICLCFSVLSTIIIIIYINVKDKIKRNILEENENNENVNEDVLIASDKDWKKDKKNY